jgi:hypothetical protein
LEAESTMLALQAEQGGWFLPERFDLERSIWADFLPMEIGQSPVGLHSDPSPLQVIVVQTKVAKPDSEDCRAGSTRPVNRRSQKPIPQVLEPESPSHPEMVLVPFPEEFVLK